MMVLPLIRALPTKALLLQQQVLKNILAVLALRLVHLVRLGRKQQIQNQMDNRTIPTVGM